MYVVTVIMRIVVGIVIARVDPTVIVTVSVLEMTKFCVDE